MNDIMFILIVYTLLDSLYPHIYWHTFPSCINSHINSQNLSVCTLYFINVFRSLKWYNTPHLVQNKQNWECQFPKENRQEKEKTVISILVKDFQWSKNHMPCSFSALNLKHPPFLFCSQVVLLFSLLFVFANQAVKTSWIVAF